MNSAKERNERELRAVLHHRCPRCKAQAGFRCRAASIQLKALKHPHPERVALVAAGEAGTP